MFDPTPFLNGREEAITFWLLAALFWALTRPQGRAKLVSVAKAFVQPKVSGIVIAGVAYSAAIVWALSVFVFWDAWMLKDAIYWFLGTALVLTLQTAGKDERFFKKIALEVLGVGVVIQFLVNMYAFPLYVEIWLVPFAFMVGACLVFAQSNPRLEPARKVLGALVVAMGLLLLSFSLGHVLDDLDAFASLSTARAFLLAPVLTIAFLPFLYMFAVVAAYELVFMRLDRALRNNELADGREHRAVRWAVVRACGLHLSWINRFSPTVMPRLFAADSTEDVRGAVDEFARHRRAHDDVQQLAG